MANLRPVLLVSLLFLGYLIWVEWQKDYGPAPAATPAAMDDSVAQTDLVPPRPTEGPADSEPATGDLPEAREDLEPVTQPVTETTSESRPLISVTTDVLELDIDPVGGTMVGARLLDYPVEQDTPERKVTLFNREGQRLYIAQSGLLSRQAAPNHTSVYRAERLEWNLSSGLDELRVPMTWTDQSGISVTKTFIFKPGSYEIEVRHSLSNDSGQAWSGSRYEQLQKALEQDRDDGGFSNPGRYSFNGVAFYSPEEKFEKVDFDDIADDPYQSVHSNGWLAMVQHYFFAAWIPPAAENTAYSTQEFAPTGWPRYIARGVAPSISVAPGSTHEFSSRLYVGPKLQEQLEEVAPGLEHTVNYGIFTVFSKPLFWLLSAIHSFVGNWGWAIIFLTVLIKLAFFKLTEAQYKSMARMRKLQPRVEALKERYGDDRQRMSQAMMEMYKKEKVNPLGGCLPILVQIPIFIALYWVLLESVELRQAPFIGYLTNLSARDPYFILPALNAFFMIMTQRLTPTTGMDPMQAKMMKAMPVVFSVLFAFFPAGLVLYWATNAGLSLAQQWYITGKIAKAD
ncbi:MAG: membrane protein insertase YidC [Xanthomonadales bacterium]|nr:membrane protein insertase YidC [Xanthomonadales bacterium]NNL96234.1 membrane protein insertase YidC [Xanthomonadales bacterium]